jgi:hypothetical protein
MKRLDFSSKLKTSIGVSLAALVATCIADIVVVDPFRGWKPLLSQSSDIVVVECDKLRTPLMVTNNGTVYTEDPDQMLDSPVKIIAVLKGNSKIGPGQIRAFFTPGVGEQYLLFGKQVTNNAYYLPDDYRIIFLGSAVHSNLVAGKSLTDQVRTLLKYRIDDIEREVNGLQQKRQELSEGLDELSKP